MTVLAVGDDRSLSVRVDVSSLERAMLRAPGVVYFWARNFLGSVFGKHRQQWLRQKGVKFGRGGEGSRAIRVFGVNEGPDRPEDHQVVYHVRPKEARAGAGGSAVRALHDLRAEASTGSTVLAVHEFGTDIRSQRWMAVPVKTRPGSPKAWRERYPQKELVLRPGRGGKLLLYEKRKVGARGRPRKDQPAPQKERMQLRFILTRFVEMDPTLRMYDTWDQLAAYRAQQWQRATERIERDLARGRTS